MKNSNLGKAMMPPPAPVKSAPKRDGKKAPPKALPPAKNTGLGMPPLPPFGPNTGDRDEVA